MSKDRAASDRLVHDPAGGIDRLVEIMARLRDPDSGCPWDLEQDFATIAPYTIEEAYEVADAIERGAWGELEGELGDLLFQAVYHAQMGAEAGHFDFASVTRAISDKMVARHPHVFGAESRDKSAEQQTRDWERLKAAERAKKAEGGVLDGVAAGLPGLAADVEVQVTRHAAELAGVDDQVPVVGELVAVHPLADVHVADHHRRVVGEEHAATHVVGMTVGVHEVAHGRVAPTLDRRHHGLPGVCTRGVERHQALAGVDHHRVAEALHHRQPVGHLGELVGHTVDGLIGVSRVDDA